MPTNPIISTIDLNAEGVHHGHLRLPYSHDASAWGAIMIPITVIKNGPGPTALLTGANHGDEYEGPITLLNLAYSIKASDISGRVIIVPMMNHPAFMAGRRTSPLDSGNLNRLFPGRPDGSSTEKIADYFQNTLLPMADVVLDIHAGGKTLDFIPFVAAHELEDAEQQARCLAAMDAFNAPYSMILKEMDPVGMYDTAAEDMGKTFISTELGGGGTATARSVAIARRGVENLLKHVGVLDGTPDIKPSQKIAVPSDDCYITSETSGLLEMCVDLGEPVKKGQVFAMVHDVERCGITPRKYTPKVDGILAGRHFPGLVKVGDCLGVIAIPDGTRT